MICQILICILLTVILLFATFLPCYNQATGRNKLPWEKLLMLRTKEVLENYKYVWVLFILTSVTVIVVFLLTKDDAPDSPSSAAGNIIISICLSYIAGFIFYQINDFLPKTKDRFFNLSLLYQELWMIKYILGGMLVKDPDVPDILVDFEDFIKKYDPSYKSGREKVFEDLTKSNAMKFALENISEIASNIRSSYSRYIDVEYVAAINLYSLLIYRVERILRTNTPGSIIPFFIELKSFYSKTIAYSREIEPYVCK